MILPTHGEDLDSTLHSASSFAIYNNPLEHDDTDPQQVLKKTTPTEFSFGLKKMDFIEENDVELEPPSSPPMYLAVSTGVGIDGTGFDHIVGSYYNIFNHNLQQGEDLEEPHKTDAFLRMLNTLYTVQTSNLLLSLMLHQSKRDIEGAEEYFLRDTRADPNDGEILMYYAKLVWEQHHDEDKALDYFECADRPSPQDSFLWETEDDENEVKKHETESKRDLQAAEDYYSHAILADPSDGETMSEYARLEWELPRDR
ncbi:hypothetical protein TanjilG_03906 [Lupinus angustifolius]|uniref:Uncharacterized protein n=1 Tax=Lupinus angustifolius TaxID=3871 RepID=A0A4P1R4S4_LUPAN|nr:hypothetical protein TanjilG_03906 [Lupinus angustifolius]